MAWVPVGRSCPLRINAIMFIVIVIHNSSHFDLIGMRLQCNFHGIVRLPSSSTVSKGLVAITAIVGINHLEFRFVLECHFPQILLLSEHRRRQTADTREKRSCESVPSLAADRRA